MVHLRWMKTTKAKCRDSLKESVKHLDVQIGTSETVAKNYRRVPEPDLAYELI